jgi:DNA mismatch endonuclease Vsr
MPDIYSPEKRSSIMSSVRNKDTLPELIVQSLLQDIGIEYQRNKKICNCKPDIIIPNLHKALFINGCFWHGHNCPRGHLPESNHDFWAAKIESNKQRDNKNHTELANNGWDVLVLWACELKKRNIGDLLTRIRSFLYNNEGVSV